MSRPAIPILAGIAGAVILSWTYLAAASTDMYGSMDGLSAWMMLNSWDGRYFVYILLMWAVMMTGMMLPSAAPAILIYAKSVANRAESYMPVTRGYAFTAGYLLAWTGFSVLATTLQWFLASVALISPMMESASPTLGASLLIAAGIYQWTPLKQTCLKQCRSPVQYLSQHWRPGVSGALTMGAGHGLYCLGCCWALMLLLFFGGVMNILWIAGITLFVLVEKLFPFWASGQGALPGYCLSLQVSGCSRPVRRGALKPSPASRT